MGASIEHVCTTCSNYDPQKENCVYFRNSVSTDNAEDKIYNQITHNKDFAKMARSDVELAMDLPLNAIPLRVMRYIIQYTVDHCTGHINCDNISISDPFTHTCEHWR